MSSPGASLGQEYFDDLYSDADDPWSFATSPYEQAKYAETLAALPRPRYQSAFEIGCSVGVLTVALAARCEALLAVDVAQRPLEQARQRCRDLPWVRFEQMEVPRQFPDESFDLVVVSEVGYYWSSADLRAALQLIIDHLRPAGHLLLVHWTPFVDDYPLTGDQVHETARSMASDSGVPLAHVMSGRQPTYRLDLFMRSSLPAGQPVESDSAS